MRIPDSVRALLGNDPAHVDGVRFAIGSLESRFARSPQCVDVNDAEFCAFSQWGEDGIIQYLISRVPVAERSFVEFGVGDYSESNTRFLLMHDNWRGLIMDGGSHHIAFARRSGLAWKHDLTAIQAFVTRENIDGLLSAQGFAGDIGLLSIDIDGNDYWVLEACTVVQPRILVVEYNSLFGATRAVTVPYDPNFSRMRAHHSGLYAGASLPAIVAAAVRKGYRFVASNRAGNNAFFVRSDIAGDLRSIEPQAGYVASRFRESRDPTGRLTFVGSHLEQLRLIADLALVDVETGRTGTVREFLI
jgi:hypothetical protein